MLNRKKFDSNKNLKDLREKKSKLMMHKNALLMTLSRCFNKNNLLEDMYKENVKNFKIRLAEGGSDFIRIC